MKYLILDTETNGIGTFRPARQRLVQWSWILYDEKNGNTIEKDYFVYGADKISEHVPHSITVDYLQKNGHNFLEVYKIFKKDLNNIDIIVAHNLSFDIGILRNEMKLNGLIDEERDKLKKKRSFCTMKQLTEYCNILRKKKDGSLSKQKKWPNLAEMYFKLFNHEPTEQLHDSLDDCRVLLKCFKKCRRNNII